MPYKDKKKAVEAMKRYRDNKKEGGGITEAGITGGITYFKDGVEMVYRLGALPDRPRYLTLHDGQVLDRVNQRFAGLKDGQVFEREVV